MRDPARIPEVLRRLGEVWAKHPDLRLGQLIENAYAKDKGTTSLFYMEDERFIRMIEKLFSDENNNTPQALP